MIWHKHLLKVKAEKVGKDKKVKQEKADDDDKKVQQLKPTAKRHAAASKAKGT